MNIENNYLFVYGTLRKGFSSRVFETIKDDIEWISYARIKGELYDIGRYPAALTVNFESYITGEIIKIKDPVSVLQLLDTYEGYDPENEIRSEYYRRKEWVELENGTKAEAWIYWYNFPVDGKQKIPDNDYLKYLEKK